MKQQQSEDIINILTLEQMHTMSIDEIVNVYRNRYRLENTSEISSLQILGVPTTLGLVFMAGLAVGALIISMTRK